MPVLATAAIGAGVSAAGKIVSGTIDNLFKNKVYKSQADKAHAEADAIALQSRVAYLTNQQKQELAIRLQNTQDEQEQLKILSDATSAVTESALNAAVNLQAVNQSGKTKVILIVSGILVVAAVAAIVILKKTKK